MENLKIGDIVKLNRKIIFSCDHGNDKEPQTEITTDTDLIVLQISPNNTKFLTVSRIGKKDNLGVQTKDLI